MSLSRFLIFRYKLGNKDGLITYFKTLTKNVKSIHLRSLKHPVKLRSYKEDFFVFDEIMIRKVYRIPFKIPIEKIIDCGGNIGLASVYFANVYPNARIAVVEPDPANFEMLTLNCKPYSNITGFQKGIWNDNVHLKVTDRGNNPYEIEVGPTDDPSEAICEAITIQQVIEQMGWESADLVKMDVEGAEKWIFENNTAWLDNLKLLIIELHENHVRNSSRPVLEALLKQNFRFFIYNNLLFCLKDGI